MIRHLRHYITAPLIGYLILALGIGYAVGRVHSIDKAGIVKNEQRIALQEQRQHEQLIEGCERLNVLRASDNASHYADYNFITLQITQGEGSLRTNYLALQKVGIPQPVLNRALKQSEQTFKVERAQAAAKSWVPLTNCQQAVATHGITYPTPIAIPFEKRKPLASALDPVNAAKLVPVGSVG